MAASDVTHKPGHRELAPRAVNIVLGVWLFISAFIWPHSSAQSTNTWLMGVLCVLFAWLATTAAWARYLNTVLAVWLFISVWALPGANAGTAWNNALVAIAIFFVSLVETGARLRGPGVPLTHHAP
jgi:hypothetical protein